MSLEFRLLGPVAVVRDGKSVSLGPPKRRAMLVALVFDPNRPVSLARLTEALWPGTPPASSVANLRTHASMLRRRLGDRLTSRPGAYQLRIDDGELDVDEFARLAGAGRQALAAGDTGTALCMLSTALRQWRGCAGDGLLRGT